MKPFPSSSSLIIGTIVAWPSPVLPKYTANNTKVKITEKEISWMVSVMLLFVPVGCLIARYFCDRHGRKLAILVTAIPAITSNLMILMAVNPIILYIARSIAGIVVGMVSVASGVYVSEISDKEIRGALSSLNVFMYNLGSFLMFAIGPSVSYNTLNWLHLSIPIFYFVLCIWLPESPLHYLKEGKINQAKDVVRMLSMCEDLEEINEIILKMHLRIAREMRSKTGVIELLSKPRYRKGLLVLTLLKAGQNMNGILTMQSYMGDIFDKSIKDFSVAKGCILFGSIEVIAPILTILSSDKVGRRPLLIFSALGSTIAILFAAIYLQYRVRFDKLSPKRSYIILVLCIMVFDLFSNCGMATIPFIMQNEIFPINVRSAASSVGVSLGSGMAFATTKWYHSLSEMFGLHVVFYLAAIVCFICGISYYIFVPETKGKSFQEIQGQFDSTLSSYPSEVDLLTEDIFVGYYNTMSSSLCSDQ